MFPIIGNGLGPGGRGAFFWLVLLLKRRMMVRSRYNPRTARSRPANGVIAMMMWAPEAKEREKSICLLSLSFTYVTVLTGNNLLR